MALTAKLDKKEMVVFNKDNKNSPDIRRREMTY